ncbi:MAG: mandelate racemase/muconate lactonizing enzyme family protein [Hydrogenophaga sp.]|uniref:mandelate racemase/muconate lactonizing enzyme family protein n=1 Tax=Hydrogenophaga sp. TaxID=1904254 RepID=UPI0016AF4181|nr:mandelate racemase/muconate lactonizing enzyme family protein [Hydrogenophaga sp.]NIM42744.1 mandelate racemase/muconate lactonizing enzyme family protein [Hydrogenophaga sp.]NIN25787.1 mandelate racemase/muconate lactonizing enzyme family protein [Hydrogenophaga sp.]NIN30449.1 mandelate racemase/muconate lactonizing enzyme family protein [Hydrogenophaga sp.]NIN56789.1 mandelate racemase/muconate lactonizing enzyme family protein [Hydrogenophaga sp.]NIO53364.1 mandelate racemase/muconate la
MKIARVWATPLNLPVTVQAARGSKTTSLSVCLVSIETDNGLIGTGMTAITEEEVIGSIVNDIAAHHLVGLDPMRHEQIWERLYWLLTPRGQSGYASHAIAAIDLALWDIKGQALGEPCWRLLGGARDEVPVYATFGFAFFERDELASAAKDWVSRGFTRLKMTVGHHALARRDEPRPLDAVIAEDVQRIRAVREAVGPDVQIYIDANCSLDYFHALKLAKQVEAYDISFFEEPVTHNDIPNLQKLRAKTGIPLAAGQNEGLATRFRDLLVAQAVDVVQPNACISGGFTQCGRIAGMAAAFNTRFANGGAWPHHNMHLHAGLANGSLVEYHSVAVQCCELVFDGLPKPERGVLRLPQAPGLGFKPNPERLAELARRPGSRGAGKA